MKESWWTGKKVTRVIIYDALTDRYFFPNRPRWSKQEPNALALIGGVVEENESSEEALRRELEEELIFDECSIDKLRLVLFGEYPANGWVSSVFILPFFGNIQLTEQESEKGIEGKWYTVDELQNHPDGVAFQHAQIINDHRGRQVLRPVSEEFASKLPGRYQQGIQNHLARNFQ